MRAATSARSELMAIRCGANAPLACALRSETKQVRSHTHAPNKHEIAIRVALLNEAAHEPATCLARATGSGKGVLLLDAQVNGDSHLECVRCR